MTIFRPGDLVFEIGACTGDFVQVLLEMDAGKVIVYPEVAIVSMESPFASFKRPTWVQYLGRIRWVGGPW